MGFPAKVIVVSGPPRSGTTLANRLLTASPQCAPFVPECSFITREIEQYANILLYSDKERFAAYFNTIDNCKSCFKACVTAHLEALLHASPQVRGFEYVVLKDPMLALYLTQAQDLLPFGTRFVLTVRNPLAVIASMKQVDRRKGTRWKIRSTVNNILNFYYSLTRVRQEGLLRSAVYIKYEDLVRGKNEKLEEFLGFAVNDTPTAGKHDRDFDRKDPFYTQLYEKPVTDERINAWRSELSKLEVLYAKRVCAGVMDYWDYK